jgi:hypothetical protein
VIPVNIGDEATRFTFHIIRRYHELPSVVIFTQVCMASSVSCYATLAAPVLLRGAARWPALIGCSVVDWCRAIQ